ncbi:acetylornithine transaminase [Jeotgalibacillus soli]|uniref:Acetylornithine aminotransferase n=1 Tax=Jeotgalibacillus soli TaxID=889306 RepID=A0A0C2W065_9BACL|nr:acetylornithine transaminase [Jeotgalibacillus soli]KIL49568.1 acetylornithine aminotransferase [Jeotgalibacillus soli]
MSSLFQNYQRRSLNLVKGNGTVVEDDKGREYLDFTSGIAVVSLGHSNPAILKALKEQSEKLWHVSNLFESPAQEQLASSLTAETPFEHAFFCNSGAEANEAAIKLARKFTGKNTIITFNHSFHGRTFGAMSATGQDKIKQGFGPMLESFRIIPYNDPMALQDAVDHDVAAIMLEVIQGEGGVNQIDEEFAAQIAQVCKEQDILLIVDEVQTGIGRTAKKYAFEHTVLKPDIMTLAKALGNGFPIGAMLGAQKLFNSFGPGSHGTTFGGNPLAVSVAQAVIDQIFDPSFLQQVEEKGAYLTQQLQVQLGSSENIKEIRGKGLIIGIECRKGAAELIQEAENAGLLIVPAGPNVLRLLPPLTVSKEEIDQAVAILSSLVHQSVSIDS